MEAPLPRSQPVARCGRMSTVDVADTLAFLLGTWEIRRVVEDHRLGCTGSFTGTVRVERSAGGAEGSATYREVGEVRFGAHRGPAHRLLELRPRVDGAVMVHFADGRPFVDLDLRGGTWRAIHDCAADSYELTTAAQSSTLLTERWCVRGPTKRYDAEATLVRLP